jgi:hypothetical protein
MLGIGRHRASEAVMLQGREWCVCSRKPRVGLTGANSGVRQGGVCGLPAGTHCARVAGGSTRWPVSKLSLALNRLAVLAPDHLLARVVLRDSRCNIKLAHFDPSLLIIQIQDQSLFSVKIPRLPMLAGLAPTVSRHGTS